MLESYCTCEHETSIGALDAILRVLLDTLGIFQWTHTALRKRQTVRCSASNPLPAGWNLKEATSMSRCGFRKDTSRGYSASYRAFAVRTADFSAQPALPAEPVHLPGFNAPTVE